jgi:hypothetical protein
MSIEEKPLVEIEVARDDISDISPKPNFILEYMLKYGDGVFEVCEDCFENTEANVFTSNDYMMEMNDDGSILPLTSSSRRRSFW